MIMGYNGIAIDTFDAGGLAVDLHTLLIEYSAATQQLRRVSDTMPDIGAVEFIPSLDLTGVPGDRSIYLTWNLNTPLSPSATWRIIYTGPEGAQSSPINGIPNAARAYSLTGLTNYTLYGVTLNAMLSGTPILTDTVTIMPTDIFIHLPTVHR